jgi:signal transduction histidine kinase
VTALATAIVALALVVASVALVVSLQNTLAGRARQTSAELVRDASKALKTNQPIPSAVYDKALLAGIVLQVRDEQGHVVPTMAGGPQTDIRLLPGTPSDTPLPDIPDLGQGTQSADGGLVIMQSNGNGMTVRLVSDSDNIIVSDVVNTPAGTRQITAITPLAQVAHSIDPVVVSLRIGTPLLILLVGGVTWFITGRALRPIEDLRLQAESISQTHPDAQLPVPTTGDEVARLAHTLNDMLARIDSSSRRQSEFVSDASHELRSPITSMHTALEVASLHPETTTVEELSSELLGETTRMQNMVNALLTLARLQDGQNAPLEAINLAPAISAATGEPTSELVVEADASQIEGALRNLVDNARRYANSSVEVSVIRADNNVTIVVDDDGPGIPTEQRERIFERFARLDEGRSRADGGVGIGLALVQRIAERHHGTITVDDSPLGGARFSLQLPLRQPT